MYKTNIKHHVNYYYLLFNYYKLFYLDLLSYELHETKYILLYLDLLSYELHETKYIVL